MSFRKILGLLLLLYPLGLWAQESKTPRPLDSPGLKGSTIDRIRQLNSAASAFNRDSTNKALIFSHEAYLLSLKVNNKELQIASLLNLSEGYLYNDIYDQALQYGYSALDIALKNNNKNLLADCYTNLGWIFYDTENATFSLQNHQEANQLYDAIGDNRKVAFSLNAIGLVYQMKGANDSAKFYFHKALKLSQELSLSGMASAALNNIGICENVSANYRQAILYFQKAMDRERDAEDLLAIAETCNQMAFSYLQLKEYKHADSLLKKSRDLINNSTSNSRKEKLLDNLFISSKLYEAVGDYSNAFSNLKEYTNVNNEIISRTKSDVVATLKLKREAGEKEAQIRELQIQKEMKQLERNALIGGIFLLIIIGFLLFSRLRQQQKRKEEMEAINQKLIRKELENTRIEKESLNAKLEYKNIDLKNYALYISQRNELIREFISELKEAQPRHNSKDENDQEFHKLIRKFQNNLDINSDAQEFNVSVDEMQKDFFFNLLQKYPELTDNERRLCGQIRLNLSIKEIASLNNISVKSVEMARYRLRKQLNLQKGDDLNDFLKKF